MGFSDSCTNIKLNGFTLQADCLVGNGDARKTSKLNLVKCLRYDYAGGTIRPASQPFRISRHSIENTKKAKDIALHDVTILRASVWTKKTFGDVWEGTEWDLNKSVRNSHGLLEFVIPTEYVFLSERHLGFLYVERY
jgi:hypothetical protein